MDLFFNHKDVYERLYNCSGIDPWTVGPPNVILGSVYVAIGIVLEIMYIPCMMVLLKPELRQYSCYKLMFLLGLYDMATLVVNCIITGYLTIKGAMYCSYPVFIYFTGVSTMVLWCGTCLTGVILGFNRAIDLWFPRLSNSLFGGFRTYVWFIAPFSYSFIMGWLAKTFCFSTRGYAWYNSPYVLIPELDTHPEEYHSGYHVFNNCTAIVLFFLIYIILSVSVWYKTRNVNSQKISKIQKQLIYQSCALCFFIFLADAIYVYAQYYSAPPILVSFGHCNWIACHASAVIIYFTCNETIQRETFELLRIKKIKGMFSASVAQTMVETTEHFQRKQGQQL
ncbi:hypothetical protein QR680_016212 [Steinernema hermaphroditum]|uniref:Uncharacterized protein n=1 Tax=Steinernema hermaphroditum TaxID=289476 RepID=A0AA39HBE4_9BILA|nr:hypothetical protein QR680_016212 [Steinernema hermaphroditum]